MMKLVGAAARLAVAAVTMFATANGQCSAEHDACLADADCLAIANLGASSCSGGCELGMAEAMTQQPDGTEAMALQPDGTCVGPFGNVDAACVYTAAVDEEEMLTLLNANTLGSAYTTCQAEPPEPCPYDDTISDGTAVLSACTGDAACAAMLGAANPNEEDEPDQALVLSSGW